jgi:hypothetical protein
VSSPDISVGVPLQCHCPAQLFKPSTTALWPCITLQADYPAYIARFLPNCVVAVAAVGPRNDMLADFSNWGSDVLLAAPVRCARH